MSCLCSYVFGDYKPEKLKAYKNLVKNKIIDIPFAAGFECLLVSQNRLLFFRHCVFTKTAIRS